MTTAILRQTTETAWSTKNLLAPPNACKPASGEEQVRCFLTKIIALTFNVDFDELNAALYDLHDVCVPQGSNCIISGDEHQCLISLSDVVRRMYGQTIHGDVNSISRDDEAILRENILGPSDDLDLHLGFSRWIL